MNQYKTLTFNNREEWRRWLTANYAREDGVWLVHYNKKSGRGGLSHIEAMEEALSFGWIDSVLNKRDAESFVLKYTPRRARSIWSKINREKAEKLIAAGKMTPAGLAKIAEAKKNGLWDKAYTNLKKERMPADLKKALMTEKNAWANFQGFANSYRNMYIGWVNNAKTVATRNRRISVVLERARNNRKLLGVDK